eukprot:SAG11_NODE_4909_length_1725_cov_4.039360_3_plen_350_part_00
MVYNVKEQLKKETQKQKEELEQAQSEIEHLSQKMFFNTKEKEKAVNQLEGHLNRTKYMNKIGFVEKSTKGFFTFTDLYRRGVLCHHWYSRTSKCQNEHYFHLGNISVCERLGPCPFARNVEERNIELKLSGTERLRKSSECGKRKYPCCFTAEDCWFWHREEDTARGVPFNDQSNEHKRQGSSKATPKELQIHYNKVAKENQRSEQKVKDWYTEALDMIEAREKKLDEDYPEERKPYDKLLNRSPLYLEAVEQLVKAGRLTVSIEDLEGEPSITRETAERQEAAGQPPRHQSHFIRDNFLHHNLQANANEIQYVEEEPPRRSPRDHASNHYRGKYGGAASEPEAEGPSN